MTILQLQMKDGTTKTIDIDLSKKEKIDKFNNALRSGLVKDYELIGWCLNGL